ncbi:exonuclease domain-containing protein [Marinoscillum sp.]|uniref:exonuclease domain-containing protein n=1 Tax=Marinoscillum sp. TaxID=2024838 RepID=UPI003BAD3C51
MSAKLYSVIDVETTGGTTHSSRVTDISIFVTDGKEILDEFSSLINPEMFIPGFITQLTGIDNEMVAGAPTFSEVAQRVLDITAGTTFVAHNVNFDFGMISSEFRRLGYAYERPKLCTVRLSRQFIPGHRSYGLGKICEDLGIPIHGRHRARGDAEATVQLFRMIMEASGGDLNLASEKWVKSLPHQLKREQVDRLPEGAGVYYFYNDQGTPIFIGSAGNLFKKVKTLLVSKARKAMEMKSLLADIDFESTGSELIARLKVMSAIQEHQPVFNHVPNRKAAYSVSVSTDLFGYIHLQVSPRASNNDNGLIFNTRREGEAYLEKLCKQYDLCPQLCGLKPGERCTEHMCLGACRQLEPAGSHNTRIQTALAERSFSKSDFVIVEKGLMSNEQAFVMIEDHEYIGYGVVNRELHTVSTLDDFRNYLNTDTASQEKIAIIQTYLSKNKPRIISTS